MNSETYRELEDRINSEINRHPLLTDEQNRIHRELIDWFDSEINPGWISVGGYAGTGKTHLIACLSDTFKDIFRKEEIALCAYTGKASFVLKKRLKSMAFNDKADYIGTIHSFIYWPEVDGKGRIIGWKKRPKAHINKHYGIIIIDEASMVSENIWKDLQSYHVPIIAVGDHGQLPPVGDQYSLVQNPDLELTEIHRQALNSPIIRLSVDIREGKYIPFGQCGKYVHKIPYSRSFLECVNPNDPNIIILCGLNHTRVILTKYMRRKLGFMGNIPEPGERLVCLKNNHDVGIMNGQTGTLIKIGKTDHPKLYEISLKMDDTGDKEYEVLMHTSCFGERNHKKGYIEIRNRKIKRAARELGYEQVDLFDFGYVLSVHKAQGSEWDTVVLVEERAGPWDDEFYRRWLYTGITRASNRLYILGQQEEE